MGLGALLLLALVAMLTVVPAAQAGTLPDICTEYPDAPGCEDPGGGGNNPPGGGGGGGDGPGVGPGGGSADPTQLGGGDGNLPFTGYPVSWLILFALLLLALGLAARTAMAAHRSVQKRFAGDASQDSRY